MKTSTQISGAVWCDPAKYPQWKTLPNSFFDYRKRSSEWTPALLEFRFFYEWDGASSCLIRFSAGCRFRLLLNGEFLEDGPVEPGGDYGKTDSPDWWFSDSMEITSRLQPGRNEFRFQVCPVPVVQSDYSTGSGWVWCMIDDGNGWHLPGEWQFKISKSYSLFVWEDQEEKPSDWTCDCVPANVPLPLTEWDLPALTNQKFDSFRYHFPFGKGANVKRSGKKLLIRQGRPFTLFLELPREMAGHFEIRTNGRTRTHFFMEFQELYGVKPDMYANERFLAKTGESSYRTFRIYGCRYIKIDVIPSGFGTMECDEPVTVEFLFWERAFPLGRKRKIKYPEPWLEELDLHCLNSLRLCMQRFHLDSPAHHEALGCTGDYRIGAKIAALAYGETRLAGADLYRTTLLLRQQGKMFHTSYELCYVLMMKEYLEHGGAYHLVSECYDGLKIVYHHYKSMTGPEHLISEADNYLFIDWVVDGEVSYHHPPADRGMTALTALWYGALEALIFIASQLGETNDAEEFAREACNVRRAFNQYFWDDSAKAYVDGIPGLSRRSPSGWLPPENGEKVHTSLGNIMALAFGLPEERQHPEQLLQRVINGELRLRPTTYYMEYLFMAADRYRLDQKEKIRLISRYKQFLQEGIRESWIAGDYCHVWSASPAYWIRKKGFLK